MDSQESTTQRNTSTEKQQQLQMPLSSLPFPPKIHSFCCSLLLSMEDSPPISLPRLRKNPTFTTTATNPSRKLKLFCSFNGAFRFSLSPPHSANKLKYIGGETRIVSIDRSITLSRLRSKISDLCPKLRPFSLKYQLLVSGRVADPESRLVSLDSDRSLRRMVEEYEKLEMYGKLARLWIFVVRDDSCVSDVNCDVGDESKRKMVVKERFLKTGLERIRLSGLDSYNSETKREYYHPLIDLGSEQKTVLDHRLGDVSFEGRENFGSLVQHSVHSSRSLNPRDGNLQAKRNGVLHCSSEQNAQTFGSGTRSAVGNLSNLRESGVIPLISSKQNSCNVGEEWLSKLNRENVMPWGPMSNSRSRRNQWDGNAFCHKPSENNARDQQIKPFQIHSHASNQTNTGSNGSVRLGGKHSGRNCYLGFRPNASISKQGQFIRSHCSDYWEPGFTENPVERRLRMRNSGNNKDRSNIALSGEQNGLVVSHNGNLATSKCHLSYHDAGSPVAENCFSACNFIDTPSCYVGTVETQQDLLTGSLCNDYQQLPIDCGPSIFSRQRVPGSSGLSSNLGLRNLECDNKFMDTGEDCNLLNQSKNEHHYPQAEISSSVDLLKKRSLVSSKEIEPAVLYSVANINSFLKPESKHLDVMKVVDKFSIGPGADESTIYASSPSCHKVHEEEEIQQDPPSGLCIHEKDDTKGSIECSTAIGGISSDLAAFYSSLATRELQTIKSSDLECIKELGSGTYGTVYYGKWKGTDVAVKKIKASCFAEGSLEDRLIADFWKEAHILGQLHHPNIVALYGVVTDGPVNNLATVTEYMVNGSLRQVLRRKDRTIDRRKRLILAMDAAFGMEYLHGKNIVHFDLKSHNLLVNMRDPWRPVCKIGDLGLSKIKQRTLVSGGVRGTIPWMAPELLRNSMVTEKVDVYSFGIVMWELLTGEEPYADMHSVEIIVGIIKGTLRPEIPCWCDQVWRSLMERCWSSDPDARPIFSEVVEELRAMSAELNIC